MLKVMMLAVVYLCLLSDGFAGDVRPLRPLKPDQSKQEEAVNPFLTKEPKVDLGYSGQEPSVHQEVVQQNQAKPSQDPTWKQKTDAWIEYANKNTGKFLVGSLFALGVLALLALLAFRTSGWARCLYIAAFAILGLVLLVLYTMVAVSPPV